MEKIDAKTLKDWIDRDQAFLLDVREPDEYSHERIGQAVNLPLSSLAGRNIACPQGKQIVLHCRSGNRSAQAAKIIAEKNPAIMLYDFTGGLQGWKREGLPVVSSQNAVLPLQRQVQIAVGILIVLTVMLGYFLHPAFLLATVFVGGGLLNAGLTGWCGLAIFLALMPWNKAAG